MPDPRGPKVGRLSDLVRQGHDLAITCDRRECGHSGKLIPEELIERYGDVSVEAINQRAVCSKCGGREIHLQISLKRAPGRPGYEPY